MCLNIVGSDWRGYVYNCDFNQMLAMPSAATDHLRPHINKLNASALLIADIAKAAHFFGPTAGQESSWTSALDAQWQ